MNKSSKAYKQIYGDDDDQMSETVEVSEEETREIAREEDEDS